MRAARSQPIVSFAVELITFDCERGEFLIRDLDPRYVGVLVKSRLDTQSLVGRRRADQIDGDFAAAQRTPSPIGGDVTEHAMLDLVPLGGSWREMANFDRELEFVRKPLQLSALETDPISIASTAISGNEQTEPTQRKSFTHLAPPASNAFNGKLGSIMVDADIDPSGIGCKVIDPIGCHLAKVRIDEAINSYLLWRANRLILSASILETTDQFLLLGID